jgi:hypothetical protein
VTAAAVYLQQRGEHVGPSRAVFVDMRSSTTWEPTESQRASPQPMTLLEALAEWIKTQVAGSLDTPELIIITDSQGANCQWISSPSNQPAAIAAAIRDARSATMDDEPSTNLAWLGDVTPGYDASVEGLSDVSVSDAKSADKPAALSGRMRLALISQPDADVRVLLDLLDAKRVVVRRVTSLWHVASLVTSSDASDAASSSDRIVVDAAGSVTATVIVEESGLVTWAWGSKGLLLAGGTQRLPRQALATATVAASPLRLTSGMESRSSEREVERIVTHIEKADIGRLIASWMSWSLQLGVAPERIVCLGPDDLACDGDGLELAGYRGLGAMAAGLGKRWPGATVNVLPKDDPIEDLLSKLVDVENRVSSRAIAAAVDPRLSLQSLSSRPAAASRAVYHWMGIAMLIGAAAIGALGWRLHGSAKTLKASTVDLVTEKDAVLKSLPEMKFPDTADPLAIINGRRAELLKTAAELRAEDPILAEAERFFNAIAGIPDLTLQKLDMRSGGVTSTADFHAPREGTQPAELVERLRASRSTADSQIDYPPRANSRPLASDQAKRTITYGGVFRPTPRVPAAPAPQATTPAAPATPSTSTTPLSSPPATSPATTEGAKTP